VDERAYWVAFNRVKGIGAVRVRALLDFFGSLEQAWQASFAALRSAGLPEKVAASVLELRRSLDLERELEKVQQAGVTLLTWQDEAYPRLLREIAQPPPVLYVRGELLDEDDWAAALVGTRRVTAYGRQVTADVAAYLGAHAVTVVSGLARGVDAIAHDAALKAGGRTIAVLGSGVDRIYPPEHEHLAARIAEAGAVVSDYALGTPPDAANFPPRNRIISGLARVVVVIEASDNSGAMITAAFAADQNRDVLAVPGGIYAPQSKGTNLLIQRGARPLLHPGDVLEAMDMDPGQMQAQRSARQVLPVNDLEGQILQTLSAEPLHIDEIGQKTGLPMDQVSAALTMMELKGMARAVGGMNYILAREESGDYQVKPNG